MRVTIIGTGYVGLVSGVCFADFGYEVVCVDKDADKIEKLNNGIIPIYEPGLADLVKQNVDEGRLSFTTSASAPVANADAVFIAVGTPTRRGGGHADLSYVYAAAEEVAQYISGFTVVVNKSTVPVGTGDKVEEIIGRTVAAGDFVVVSNPEFLREGAAIQDFKRPDRVVVGTDDERARAVMRKLYRPFYLNETPIQFTDRRTSELIKYAANAFLAMKITFINEIADLCEAVDANVQEVARGIGLDNRIGRKFLNAGPGYGGSCFPKDIEALVQTAISHKSPVRLVETTSRVNSERKQSMARKIIAALDGEVEGKRIAILGLAFKPNTDDMRDAPSIDIIHTLQAAGADNIVAYDPESMEEARKHLNGLTFGDGAYNTAKDADVLVIITEWDHFRALDLKRIKNDMRGNVLVDLRNIYNTDDAVDHGFHYVSVGRATPERNSPAG